MARVSSEITSRALLRDSVSIVLAALLLSTAQCSYSRNSGGQPALPGDAAIARVETGAEPGNADGAGSDAGLKPVPVDGALCDAAAEEPLSQPEALAVGQSGLRSVASAGGRAVWAESHLDPSTLLLSMRIFREGNPSPMDFDLGAAGTLSCGRLRAYQGRLALWYVTSSTPYGGSISSGILRGNLQTSAVDTCANAGNDEPVAIDASGIYLVAPGFASGALVQLQPTPGETSCAATELAATDATGIATDDKAIYLFSSLESGADASAGGYSIQRVSKAAMSVNQVAKGFDPAPPVLWWKPIEMAVRAGSVFWSHPQLAEGLQPADTARRIWVCPPGSGACEVLVDDPDGLFDFAVDGRYVYWATATGLVKRMRTCGGSAEVIAHDQDLPVSIAVGDSAIYWLDQGTAPGTGKVMRIRKLDAPDGGADAGNDATADPDASPDAGPG